MGFDLPWTATLYSSAAFAIAAVIVVFIIHLMFAVGVYHHADELESNGLRTYFVGSIGWSITAFVFGLPLIALYWVMHCSSLNVNVPRLHKKLEESSEPTRYSLD